MKNKKVTESYFTAKDTGAFEAASMAAVVVGVILVLLWTFFYLGFGFFGLPLLIVGGAGVIFLRSARVTDEDYEAEIKRILTINGVEENDMTLKEYVVGKSDVVKIGKDKRVRTAYYSVAMFEFKNEVCKLKKYSVDVFNESVTESEYTIPVGTGCSISERKNNTPIGEITSNYLVFEGLEELIIPVDMNVYDTEAVMKRMAPRR